MVHRLQNRAQFQAVLGGAGAIAKTRHFALHRLLLELPVPQAESAPGALPVRRPCVLFEMDSGHPRVWVGALVPKRWARRAVTRNTFKRQIYTLFRDSALPPTAAAYVVRLSRSFDRASFVSATSDLLKAAVRAELHQLLALAAARS